MLAAVINNSCKKLDSISKTASTEEIEAKFFATKPGTPAIVHKVIAALKKQNSLGHFVPSLAKKDGYAIWEKSQVSIYNKALSRNGESETQETLVFTPIVPQDSNFVNGFFFSRIIGDSVELHLYRANDYDKYPFGRVDSSIVTAELITTKLLELNRNVFGNRKFTLADDHLWENIKNQYGTPDTISRMIYIENSPSSNNLITVVCTITQNCSCISNPGSYNESHQCMQGNCDWCNLCRKYDCSDVYSDEPGQSGGGNPWPTDPPTSIGGGGGSNPPNTGSNCSGVNDCGTNGSIIIQGKVPCGGCGNGPVVVVPPDEPPYYPPFYGSNQVNDFSELLTFADWENSIDTSRLSNYPCIINVIDSLIKSPSFYTVMKNFTGVNPTGHVEFDTTSFAGHTQDF